MISIGETHALNFQICNYSEVFHRKQLFSRSLEGYFIRALPQCGMEFECCARRLHENVGYRLHGAGRIFEWPNISSVEQPTEKKVALALRSHGDSQSSLRHAQNMNYAKSIVNKVASFLLPLIQSDEFSKHEKPAYKRKRK